jgi:hypothetical protein
VPDGRVPDLPGQRLQAAAAGHHFPAPPSGCLRTTPLKERGCEAFSAYSHRSQDINSICSMPFVRSRLSGSESRAILDMRCIHRNHIQRHADVAEVKLTPRSAERTHRCAEHCARLAVCRLLRLAKIAVGFVWPKCIRPSSSRPSAARAGTHEHRPVPRFRGGRDHGSPLARGRPDRDSRASDRNVHHVKQPISFPRRTFAHGWEATRHLKDDPQTRDIPIIALSAMHSPASAKGRSLPAATSSTPSRSSSNGWWRPCAGCSRRASDAFMTSAPAARRARIKKSSLD